MDISWSDLGAAFALMLIIEGMTFFINPSIFRRILAILSEVDTLHVRLMGAAWMGVGLLVLYWARGQF